MKLDIAQVFSTAFEMVQTRFLRLLGLWGVFFGAQIAIFGLLFLMIGGLDGIFSGESSLSNMSMGVGLILAMIVMYFGFLYIYCAQACAMAIAASPLDDSPFGEALSRGLRSGVSLFGVFVLLAIGYTAAAFVLNLFGFLGSAGRFVIEAVTLFGLIYLACRFIATVPVVAVDQAYNPVLAIQRAWTITEGNVLRILLLVLLLIVLSFVALFVVGGVFFGFSVGAASIDNVGSSVPAFLGILAVFFLVGIVASMITSAIFSAVHAGLSATEAEELSGTFE